MNKSLIIIAILTLSLLLTCKSDKEEETQTHVQNEFFEENFRSFKIDEYIIKIGTMKKSYYIGDTVFIEIKDLPQTKYKVRVDGREDYKIRSERIKYFEVIPNMTGTRRHAVQIYDIDKNIVLNEIILFKSTYK